MDRRTLAIRGSLALLAALAVLYLFSPDGLVRQVWYDGLGLVSVVFAWFGMRYRRPTHVRAWHLVLLGFLGWVLRRHGLLARAERLAARPTTPCRRTRST